MNDWRDDLPPIPAERIRVAVVHEGARRLERRRQIERRARMAVRRHRLTPVAGRVDRGQRRRRRRAD